MWKNIVQPDNNGNAFQCSACTKHAW